MVVETFKEIFLFLFFLFLETLICVEGYELGANVLFLYLISLTSILDF